MNAFERKDGLNEIWLHTKKYLCHFIILIYILEHTIGIYPSSHSLLENKNFCFRIKKKKQKKRSTLKYFHLPLY